MKHPQVLTHRYGKKLSALILAEQLRDGKLKYLPSTVNLSIIPIFLSVVNNLGFNIFPPHAFQLRNFSSYRHINHRK